LPKKLLVPGGLAVAKRLHPKQGETISISPVAPVTKPVAMSIVLATPEGSGTLYVNYLEIAHTPFDFTLLGVQIPGKLSPEQVRAATEGRAIVFDSDFQVTFPASILPALIRALIAQKDLYEKSYGIKLEDKGD
jgi:hypothetical protein